MAPCQLLFEDFDLALLILLLFDQSVELVDQFPSGTLKTQREALYLFFQRPHIIESTFARYCLYSTHARGNAAVADDLEKAYIPGPLRMGSATKLFAEPTHRHHADTVTVFFTEKRNSALFHRLFDGHGLRGYFEILLDLIVDQLFHSAQFILSERRKMGEVETEPLSFYQRTALFYVIPQHLAKRPLEDVGCGMVRRDGTSETRLDLEIHLITHTKDPLLHHSPVQDNVRKRLYRVLHFDFVSVAAYDAVVPHLAAGLAIERRPVGDQFHSFPRLCFEDLLSIFYHGPYYARVLQCLITRKGSVDTLVEDLFQSTGFACLGSFPGLAGHLPLTTHFPVEAGLIHHQTRFFCQIRRQVGWKAKRVIEPKSDFTRQSVATLLANVPCFLLEQNQAAGQSLQETLFLALYNLFYQGRMSLQFRIRGPHVLSDHPG